MLLCPSSYHSLHVVQSLSCVWLFCDPMDCSLPRLLCPPLSPRVISSSYLLNWWCYPTISFLILPCLHSKPINWEMSVGARNSNFIQKASRSRRGQTPVPKSSLVWIRIQASFILRGGVKLKISWFQSPPVCVCVLGAQLYPTLCNPVDYSLPGSSVRGVLHARILQWVAIWAVLISSFLQLFTGRPGQEVSCELNKDILA